MSAPTRRYYRGATLAAMEDVSAQATRVYHFDHQGTTQVLTDPSGAVTDRFASDAWGVEVKRTGSSINRQWYIGNWGYYRQRERMLDYVRARHYQASAAHWLSRDRTRDRTHPYCYGANNPSERTDPSGWKPTSPCTPSTPSSFLPPTAGDILCDSGLDIAIGDLTTLLLEFTNFGCLCGITFTGEATLNITSACIVFKGSTCPVVLGQAITLPGGITLPGFLPISRVKNTSLTCDASGKFWQGCPKNTMVHNPMSPAGYSIRDCIPPCGAYVKHIRKKGSIPLTVVPFSAYPGGLFPIIIPPTNAFPCTVEIHDLEGSVDYDGNLTLNYCTCSRK
jgi:RHS repeat-associated protein